uniref:Uncharacterized protein n=1 Tax=Gossypium raimondii TaxID=29730 RepID=A0A0D2QB05_GOSRA|nr:hypothetical protein B456_006G160400 [Gossypium raimondii]
MEGIDVTTHFYLKSPHPFIALMTKEDLNEYLYQPIYIASVSALLCSAPSSPGHPCRWLEMLKSGRQGWPRLSFSLMMARFQPGSVGVNEELNCSKN